MWHPIDSNWRGPIWVNVNAMLVFGMVHPRYAAVAPSMAGAAVTLAQDVLHALADDLRATGTWHECLSSANGYEEFARNT